MATVNNLLSKVSSNIGAKIDAAKAALRGPATPPAEPGGVAPAFQTPAEPGIGAQTSAALGDTQTVAGRQSGVLPENMPPNQGKPSLYDAAKPAAAPTEVSPEMTAMREHLQANAGAKAQAEMGADAATQSREPLMGRAGPQPIPEPPSGTASGGIPGNQAGEALRSTTAAPEAAGIRTATAAEQAAAKGPGVLRQVFRVATGANVMDNPAMMKLGIAGTVLAGADAADRAAHGTTSDQVAGRTTNPWLAGARQMQNTMTGGYGRKMSDAGIAGGMALFDDPGKNAGIPGRLSHAWDAAKGAWNKTAAEEAAASGGTLAASPAKPATPPTGPNSTTMSGTIGATPPQGGVTLRNGQVVSPSSMFPGGDSNWENPSADLRASAAKAAGSAPTKYLDPKATSGKPGYTTGTQPLATDENGVPYSQGPFEQSNERVAMYGHGDGNSVPASGTGAFKSRNGRAVAVGTPDGDTGVAGSDLRGAPAQTAAGVPQLGWLDKQFQTKREIAQAVAGWKVKEAQSKLAIEQQGRDATQRGVNDSILKTQIEGENDPNRPVFSRDTVGKGDNKATIDNYNNGEMQRRKADIQYTLNAMQVPQTDKDGQPVSGKDGKPVMVSAGKSYRNASPTDMQGLGLLAKFKSNTMSARSGWDQTLRDLVGEPRGDSKNLLGYKPVSAERTTLPSFGKEGGYLIHLANGNTMPVFAANGGGFNVFGPNSPRDLDLDQMVAPLIQQAQGQK